MLYTLKLEFQVNCEELSKCKNELCSRVLKYYRIYFNQNILCSSIDKYP
jgi:hypothetical protein